MHSTWKIITESKAVHWLVRALDLLDTCGQVLHGEMRFEPRTVSGFHSNKLAKEIGMSSKYCSL